MNVPPHPHCGLATVSWLFRGEIEHRDSLGTHEFVLPGELNLMTAGRGIAHSEVSTPATTILHGVQLWIALPAAHRDTAPSFEHHAERPHVEAAGLTGTVLLGTFGGVTAEGRTFSPLVGAELCLAAGARVVLPLRKDFEHALYAIDGSCAFEDAGLERDGVHVFDAGRDELPLQVSGERSARLLLVGGVPYTDPLVMWWNFVAGDDAEIVAARDDWENGRRFGDVRRYDGPRIPAPRHVARAVPANPMS